MGLFVRSILSHLYVIKMAFSFHMFIILDTGLIKTELRTEGVSLRSQASQRGVAPRSASVPTTVPPGLHSFLGKWNCCACGGYITPLTCRT